MSTQGPTREVGYENASGTTPGTTPGIMVWSGLENETEYVPDLRWPNSRDVYTKMRSDPQIDALLRGMIGPILRFRWEVDPSGARKRVAQRLAEDMGLALKGAEKPKLRPRDIGGFDHMGHVELAIRNGLQYGHMFFEMTGDIRAGLWRMTDLAPRFPHSIEDISVARNGDLEWIKQSDVGWTPTPERRIRRSRLVAFPFGKEGGNWFGRALIRSAYQPWLAKDRLIRIDVMAHERNGMGVPVVELPERASPKQQDDAQALAEQYRAGIASGGTLPAGMKLRLVGVEGSTSDVLSSIRYHDEAMARVMLQMFISMGGTGGEYKAAGLGDSFIKFFARSQDAIADWYRGIMNREFIASWVRWNYGEDEIMPQLVYSRDEDPELSAHQLSQMVAMGALTVDDDLENFLRDKYGLPEFDPNSPSIVRRQQQAQADKNAGKPGDAKTGTAPPAEGESNQNVADPSPARTGAP